MSSTVLVPADDLKAFTSACLVAAGSLKENADLVAEVSMVVAPAPVSSMYRSDGVCCWGIFFMRACVVGKRLP